MEPTLFNITVLPKPNNHQHCILPKKINRQRCVLRFDWSSILVISKLL
ncbi:unnamed protein product [Tenebrio molitor]|nr:unnamed protein product [Tenebrio molitor]